MIKRKSIKVTWNVKWSIKQKMFLFQQTVHRSIGLFLEIFKSSIEISTLPSDQYITVFTEDTRGNKIRFASLADPMD